MTVATKKLLLDVRDTGESILRHTAGKNLAEYSADRFFRRAVEREFEIIGEALNRIDRLDQPIAVRISELRLIVDFSKSNYSRLRHRGMGHRGKASATLGKGSCGTARRK